MWKNSKIVQGLDEKYMFQPAEPFSDFFLKFLDELYGLNCAKAVGHYGLPISYLVKAADFIYQPLTHIFNTSIASSIFPDEMKIAKVIPMFKSGNRCTTSNYRPISLLPTLSKIFEKNYM